MNELKRKVEAILFAVGRYISLEELCKICKKDSETAVNVLKELQKDYEQNKESSLMILNDQSLWKLTTKDEYHQVVKKIVSETELTKSQLETLAVIAFKYPIKQADLIRIRTNKAYDHIMELEKTGFITRQKYGRSKLIKLTDKFFDYFDLPREKLQERFKGFGDLAKTIEHKEEENEQKIEEQKKIAEELKKEQEQQRKLENGQIEIDLVDEVGRETKLDTYQRTEDDIKMDEIIAEDKEIQMREEIEKENPLNQNDEKKEINSDKTEQENKVSENEKEEFKVNQNKDSNNNEIEESEKISFTEEGTDLLETEETNKKEKNA